MPNQDIFQQGSAATAGPLIGDYLWSNPFNWVLSFPVNGDNVTVGSVSFDDLLFLSLTTLTETAGGTVNVTGGDLTIGTLSGGANTQLLADGAAVGATGSIVVTVGSIQAGGGTYGARGATSSFVDTSATDPGATYIAESGGTVTFSGVPSGLSTFEYQGMGTIAFSDPNPDPGSQTLNNIAPGDVLEVPGSTVASIQFTSFSMGVNTNVGNYLFFDTFAGTNGAYDTKIDPDTGLIAITFVGTDTFLATSGVDWSTPANWSNGVPVDGDSVVTSTIGDDDLAALSLASLTASGSGGVNDVGGILNIGTVAGGAGTHVSAAGVVVNATTPVIVTVGTIDGAGGIYAAAGATSEFVDNSATDPGGTYVAVNSGTVVFTAAPLLTSVLSYSDIVSNFGTFELRNPNATNPGLTGVVPGDVIEVPGTTISNLSLGVGLSVSTNTGSYFFQGVSAPQAVITGVISNFDTASGLEAISFIGPTETFQAVASAFWNNTANWTTSLGSNGIPVNGDAVVMPVSGTNDIANLSLASLTETNGAVLQSRGASLTIGGFSGTALVAQQFETGITTPVVVTVGTLALAGGTYFANGATARFVDTSTVDPGETYNAYNGGTLVLYAPPSGASTLNYQGANDTIALENPGSVIAAPLNDIDPGDVIELPGTSVTSVVYGAGLTVTTSAGTYAFQTIAEDEFVNNYTAAFDPTTGLEAITFTFMTCYRRGTRIATPAGEVAIERLAVGDLVLTASGAAKPIRWIGKRHIDCRRHMEPRKAWPIRIAAGAFGEQLPHSDLWLSPEHCVFVDDVLVPIKRLINGTTIARDAVDEVTYYHIELDNHDILLAEGLPAESYLDTGNRAVFANGGDVQTLHPVFDGPRYWAVDAAAPLANDEALVRRVWDRLSARAHTLGRSTAEACCTSEPRLTLRLDGRTLRPVVTDRHRHVFVLPASMAPIRLVSRSGYPNDRRSWIDDDRRLGVRVARILWHHPEGPRETPVDHPSLEAGWWATEREGAVSYRWTNGDASLPPSPGAVMLEIQSAGDMEYRVEPSGREAGDVPMRTMTRSEASARRRVANSERAA